MRVLIRSSHATAARRVGGYTTVRVLVPQIPCPEGGMASKRLSSGASQPLLCVSHDLIAEPVLRVPGITWLSAMMRNLASGDDGSGRRSASTAQRGIQFTPLMWPVKSVGIRLRLLSRAVSATCTRRFSACSDTHVWRRLKIFPEQEDPYGIEPSCAKPREVALHFFFVEELPPAHRRSGRPIVDTQSESRRLRTHGSPAAQRSFVSRVRPEAPQYLLVHAQISVRHSLCGENDPRRACVRPIDRAHRGAAPQPWLRRGRLR